jgi:hypothetical protein
MSSGIDKSINQPSENHAILVKTLLLVLALANPVMSIGQNKEDRDLIIKNTLYSQYDLAFETLSINYERSLFLIKENIPFLLSIGFSHTTPDFNGHGFNWYGIPVWISTYFGQSKSHFETGIGYWWTKSYNKSELYKNNSRTENTFLLKAGYRFQKLKGSGLNLRIGAEFGFYRTYDTDYWDSDFIGSLFLSLGYSF